VSEIFSVGGSLGPVRVAEGTWDASIEIAKGFRTWDFAPGAFIAEGADATVIDDKGQKISFDIIPQMEDWRRAKFTKEALDASRQKFIVAATDELAHQIVSVLGQHQTSNTKRKQTESIK
jgi:fructose-1,6-bisphosphatase/inositol monophosphatase family enzyme